jgi:hypothetical protein
MDGRWQPQGPGCLASGGWHLTVWKGFRVSSATRNAPLCCACLGCVLHGSTRVGRQGTNLICLDWEQGATYYGNAWANRHTSPLFTSTYCPPC